MIWGGGAGVVPGWRWGVMEGGDARTRGTVPTVCSGTDDIFHCVLCSWSSATCFGFASASLSSVAIVEPGWITEKVICDYEVIADEVMG